MTLGSCLCRGFSPFLLVEDRLMRTDEFDLPDGCEDWDHLFDAVTTDADYLALSQTTRHALPAIVMADFDVSRKRCRPGRGAPVTATRQHDTARRRAPRRSVVIVLALATWVLWRLISQ
jgi:hypothetical protein